MNPKSGNRLYLVTGASGYVGGRLVKTLIEENLDVRILVRDWHKVQGQVIRLFKNLRLLDLCSKTVL